MSPIESDPFEHSLSTLRFRILPRHPQDTLPISPDEIPHISYRMHTSQPANLREARPHTLAPAVAYPAGVNDSPKEPYG